MDNKRDPHREPERQIERMNRRMEERRRKMERRVNEMLRRTEPPRGSEGAGLLPEETDPRGGPEPDLRGPRPDFDTGVSPGTHSMDVDLIERDEEFVLTAAVPGFSPDEIEVSLVDGTVRIEASHEETEEEEEEGRYVMRERRRSMSRSVPLGARIDEDGELSASYENGVMTVRLPKAEPAGEDVRRINIE